ncbi:MAG: outer membrane lipoprotein carrier protein LolA [Desulfobacterales bacterium]|nr:outer membrane lipoprotein carrier protein LolA [Desulfobacterales bacterium]
MKVKILIFLFFSLISVETKSVFCKDIYSSNSIDKNSPITLNEIINKVENRYTNSGFSALFFQESTLKAMDITDTASGKIFIKRPGKMRWEYEKPENQIIITDAENLWIYRPADNQVMIGNAVNYFGDGKGGSFLSDIKLIEKNFKITFEKTDPNHNYILKLIPNEKKYDLSEIYLSISNINFDIVQIVTYNSYGDETRIQLKQLEFGQNFDDTMFSFKIPQGADIVELEE